VKVDLLVDYHGLRLAHLHPRLSYRMQTVMAKQQAAFPMAAVHSHVFLARCPALFSTVWRLFSYILPEEVVSKVTVASAKETADKLQSFAQPCWVPTALGGELCDGSSPELQRVLGFMAGESATPDAPGSEGSVPAVDVTDVQAAALPSRSPADVDVTVVRSK